MNCNTIQALESSDNKCLPGKECALERKLSPLDITDLEIGAFVRVIFEVN